MALAAPIQGVTMTAVSGEPWSSISTRAAAALRRRFLRQKSARKRMASSAMMPAMTPPTMAPVEEEWWPVDEDEDAAVGSVLPVEAELAAEAELDVAATVLEKPSLYLSMISLCN